MIYQHATAAADRVISTALDRKRAGRSARRTTGGINDGDWSAHGAVLGPEADLHGDVGAARLSVISLS